MKEAILKQYLPPTSGCGRSKPSRSAGATNRPASLSGGVNVVLFSDARSQLLDSLKEFNLDRSYTDLPSNVQELAETMLAKDLKIYSEHGRALFFVVVAELARC